MYVPEKNHNNYHNRTLFLVPISTIVGLALALGRVAYAVRSAEFS